MVNVKIFGDMTIETKYNIGQEVWWKTKNYNGKAIVESMSITIGGNMPSRLIGVKLADGLKLTFHEHELYATEEEMIKGLKKEIDYE